MKIAFNPSTVEALIAPPNNKDITFDLRGRNIFARGVKFQGTDTNTWRDIKINNVSIGSNTLDLRNGSNTTLTNTNGVVTINSTWRPVVDNLTSDSTTSSLSAKQGKVLKSLIDGKSNSEHNHDDRYLKLTGGTMASNALITFADSGSWGTDKGPQGARGGLYWTGQSDYAKLYAEETEEDNLDLVIQFGDDNSNGLSIRNKANTQTSYISAGGVITTGTFKGNLDWSYITNKPSSYTPSAHTHAWNSLTHSSTTENQAILTNGKANGWKLYTLNISRWDNAANNAHSHSNKSVLDGITSGLVNNWNIAYTFVNTITGTDTDKVINKWDEIVNFLAGITEDNKLNTLLNSKLSVYKLADNTNVGAIKNNGIYYSTSDASSGTLVNSPFNTGFTLINMTSLDNGDDLRRSRLAFNAYGEIKVSNDRDQADTAETWYQVLTSHNTYISNGSGIINGTTITQVSNADTTDGVHLEWSGQLTYDQYSWLAGWTNDGKKIKAVNKSQFATSGHTHDDRYVRAFGTSNDNIDSDWGQSFKTFDPIPSGTPPEQNPNISLLSIGNSFNRRKQLAFIYNNDNIYYRRHTEGGFSNWRRIAFANEIPSSLKNPYALTISLNGTSQGPYDGSAAKNINITPGSIGAATSGHNHDGRYLALSGGTMTGAIRFNNLINIDSAIVLDYKYSESGFARDIISMKNSVYGDANLGALSILCYPNSTSNGFQYIYLGTDKYYGPNNLRIYKDKVTFGNNILIDAGNIGSQTVANAYHLRINSVNSWSTWNWVGQGGQPSWLWGSNDGTNMYVWNPSNFRVAYALSAGNADTLDDYHISDESRQVYKNYYTVDSPAGAWILIKFPAWNGYNEIVTISGYGDNRQAHCVVHCGSRNQGIWGYQSDYNGTVVDRIRWKEVDSGKFALIALINEGITTLRIKATNSLEISKTTGDNAAFAISSSFFSSSGIFHGNVDWDKIIGKPSSYTPSAHTHSWTSITDKLVVNEFNIVNAGYNDKLWFNYLPINDRSKTASIQTYIMCNGAKGMASVTASGFIKNGSSSSYVLLGDGGHKTISSLSVNHAASAGYANGIANKGLLDSQEKIDNFITANRFEYATFKTTESNNVGFDANDGMILSMSWSSTAYGAQIAFDEVSSATVKVRGKNTSWGNWYTLLHSGNYNNYVPTKTGIGASGTWDINITGNADSATNADMVDGYHATDGRTFTGNINWSGNWNDTWSDGTNKHPWYGFDHRYPNTGAYSTTISDYFGMTIKTANTLRLDFRTLLLNGTSIYSINVASATKLQTPRKIWGNSFDGTNDIGGTILPSATHTYNLGSTTYMFEKTYTRYVDTDSGYDLRLACTGTEVLRLASADKSVNINYDANISGKANIASDLKVYNSTNHGCSVVISEFIGNVSNGGSISVIDDNGYAPNRRPLILQYGQGNVGIGIATPDYKLHVDGDIYTTTGFKKNGSSDSYVLLGGGGHALISDFAMASNYVKKAGDTMTGNLLLSAPSGGNSPKLHFHRGPNTSWAINVEGGNMKFRELTSNKIAFFIKEASQGATAYIYDQEVIHSGNIGSQSVNYAASAGNADTVDGYHATSGNDKPWGTIPAITTNGWMDIGKHLEFHFDNTTGSDYSTILRCTGNYSNIVNLPSAAGTLALTSDIPTSLPANGGNADKLDGYHASELLTALSNTNNGISITVGGTTKSISNISVNYAASAGSANSAIQATNLTPENTPHYFRDPSNSSWRGGMYWGSAGNESMSFVAVNGGTRFQFVGGSDIANWTSSTWQSVTPYLTIYSSGIVTPGSVTATNGFIKSNSSDSYVLLGGGGHKLESSLRVAYATSAGSADTAQYLKSLGNQNCQTGRTQNYGDVYTYNTYDGNTGSPTTFTSVIGFGRGIAGTVEIAGGWDNTNLYWRSLRDCCEDWHSWRTVLDSNNYTEFINNYYWANVKISTSSSTTTSPTVSNLTALSSIKMGNIYLQNTDEINNSANGSIYLNYRNSGNVSLCQGGGSVGIGTTSPTYKLDVNGQMRASGFHHSSMNSDNYILLAGGGYKSFGGDSSHPVFLGYLNLDHGSDGTVSSSFYCLGYSVPFTYTRGGNYCKISIPDTTHQAFYIKAATASVNYSGGGMDTWTGNHRGAGAWWLHCYAPSSNEVRVKGFHLKDTNNDSWWGGNPLWSDRSGVNRITVCIFGYVTFR